MDEIDIANDLAEARRELKLREIQQRKPEIGPSGFCLLRACGEPLPAGHRWCDADCRDLWEKERRR
jgi:hypothetical protein